MSLLQVIAEGLEKDDRVSIVRHVKTPFLYSDGTYSHEFFNATANFDVAPKEGLYDAVALQAFMESIVPELARTSQDDFSQNDYMLSFGKLYFDEKFPITYSVTARFVADISPHEIETVDVAQRSEIELSRRIWVNVFPSADIAQDAFARNFSQAPYGITIEDLNRYRDMREGFDIADQLIARIKGASTHD